MASKKTEDLLSLFHPAIRAWFADSFEGPTPAQVMGWPHIARGESTLILAPTGSGKTLAAFLVCIDHLLKKLEEENEIGGVHTLYISPLKALNYDIERNLQIPLAGIGECSGKSLPDIRSAVRTGDTSQRERQQMVRRPPHLLITTPESLHLILTSVRAREMLRTAQYVIVDEIHAVSENKRGTFLALLLERLEQLAEHRLIRIGLSATQRPLEEVAAFLGGCELVEGELVPRPVAIVDAGMRKALDIQVICPVEDMRNLPEDSIWPAIYRQLLELIRTHRSTLIFANNRRAVERITTQINELAGHKLVRAHHGSVSKPVRRQMEAALKEGNVPALVATASLELGIDMGLIDLVCQVESPKSVARGLQRVGRAGHLFKASSKGRLLPKMRTDLLEMATVAGAMRGALVAQLKIPVNCLDILAQQIVAMVSMKPWGVDQLFDLVRRAYPYRRLPRTHFIAVIEMLSGRYPSEAFKDLRPRISWDRVNNVLYPMPGSQRLAIIDGGAIPDTGQFGVYLEDGKTKLGELDEEFIYETRRGDVFILGTDSWRVQDIGSDRVTVRPARGEPARMPFWKGEYFNRSYELGKQVGTFSRELSGRLDDPDCESWLRETCGLDEWSARNLRRYFVDQKEHAEVIPDDLTILMEGFRDEIGDLRLAILTPYGGRLHLTWRLAILAQFRRRWRAELESLHSDNGILLRLTAEDLRRATDTVLDIESRHVEDMVIEELANSALFGLRFRQNAARALLLPRRQPGKRTPLWLQRMKARDLLEIARQYDSFPLVVETYRECLEDWLTVVELEDLLGSIEAGQIHVVVRESERPSPFASSLLFDFTAAYLYEWDTPKRGAGLTPAMDRGALDELLHGEPSELLDDVATTEVESRLLGYPARTPSELVELLRRVGDLTEGELADRMTKDLSERLRHLEAHGRVVRVFISDVPDAWRWISAEEFALYRDAFVDEMAAPDLYSSYRWIPMGEGAPRPVHELLPQRLLNITLPRAEAQRRILERFIRRHVVVTLDLIRSRYPLKEPFILSLLFSLEATGQMRKVESRSIRGWAFVENLERARRVTLARRRREVRSCAPTQFADFLLRWQHIHPGFKVIDEAGLMIVMEQLQGLSLPAEIWEDDVLAQRIEGYRRSWLDELCQGGDLIWYGSPGGGKWGRIAFASRENLTHLDRAKEDAPRSEEMETLRGALDRRGASFLTDLSTETGLPPSRCARALWEMIWRGEVTNDSFAVVRAGRPRAVVDGRLSPPHVSGRRGRYRPLGSSGRWSLVPPPSSVDPDVVARQLLLRYGLVCQEILRMEDRGASWSDLYEILVRMEWRGEIRRGYFVTGFSGSQFALPRAADELMAQARRSVSSGQMVLINACDPASIYGAASPLPLVNPMDPGWRFHRHTNNYLIVRGGVPMLAIEGKGQRLTPLRQLSTVDRRNALRHLTSLLENMGGLRRLRALRVESWNGEPVRESEVAADLKMLGFRDEYSAMVLYRRF